MKTCIKCGSHAFNLYADGIDQGGFCDVHYWQGRAHRAEAQPEQEPVACVEYIPCCTDQTCQKCKAATPPQRPWGNPWVSLTDEDYLNALDLHSYEGTDREFWKVLEAKLKELNT